jgi:hypothetical protein
MVFNASVNGISVITLRSVLLSADWKARRFHACALNFIYTILTRGRRGRNRMVVRCLGLWCLMPLSTVFQL